MKRTIPSLASWLLRRFGVPQQNEPLMGDIVEEYAAGRSLWWLGWQMLVAVAGTNARTAWRRKGLTLRAIVTGWAVLGCVVLAIDTLLLPFYVPLTWTSAFYYHAMPYVMGSVTYGMLGLVGWCIARLHRGHEAPGVFAFVATGLAYLLVSLLLRGVTIDALPKVIQVSARLALPVVVGGLAREPRTAPPPPAAPAELYGGRT